ncbi:MAG: N-acetyltransferase GCN5 [Gemmatales bacterium]|nr:MAG: N-acetyltransferase GCN5 [Gemmatales bacterium]
MALSIRAARFEDIDTIVRFNAALARETEHLDLDHATLCKGVAQLLGDPEKGRYFVAVDGIEVVGQIMVTYEWSDWRCGWLWWIQSVYVAPAARRQGVFSALFQHVLETAKAQGDVVGIRLYVEKNNVSAQQTYERQGMTMAPYLVYERLPL